MAETMAPLSLRVAEARLLNPLIRLLRLEAADGGVLPGWAPGSHIRVQVRLPDGSLDWRHYSLVDLAGAHTVLQRVVLLGEIALRLLEPAQNVAAQRMGEGLDDVIEVVRHVLAWLCISE